MIIIARGITLIRMSAVIDRQHMLTGGRSHVLMVASPGLCNPGSGCDQHDDRHDDVGDAISHIIAIGTS